MLVVARGELWRITGDAGRLAIDRVGSLVALRPELDRLRASPADRVAAAALGLLLVPARLAVHSDRALRVVLDEPLSGLPVAALRIGDDRLVAARPVVLAARASDVGCAARLDRAHRVVVVDDAVDPAGATRASLLGAARGDRLVIAARAENDVLGTVLVLRDGPLRTLEIAARAGSAGQVVLTPRDATPAATTALAFAFLAAGADQVIAPVTATSPAAARDLLDQLARGDADLLHALARIQSASDGDAALGFAAFGRDTCHPPP